MSCRINKLILMSCHVEGMIISTITIKPQEAITDDLTRGPMITLNEFLRRINFFLKFVRHTE